MDAIKRCNLGEGKGVLSGLELSEGRLALKGLTFSIDIRSVRQRHAAAAYGKRNRKIDRWVWGLELGGRGLSESMKLDSGARGGEPAEQET